MVAIMRLRRMKKTVEVNQLLSEDQRDGDGPDGREEVAGTSMVGGKREDGECVV